MDSSAGLGPGSGKRERKRLPTPGDFSSGGSSWLLSGSPGHRPRDPRSTDHGRHRMEPEASSLTQQWNLTRCLWRLQVHKATPSNCFRQMTLERPSHH